MTTFQEEGKAGTKAWAEEEHGGPRDVCRAPPAWQEVSKNRRATEGASLLLFILDVGVLALGAEKRQSDLKH